MKKLLFILLTVIGANAATFEYDMRKGIDLTGQSSITAAQINQLVDGATPYPGKGLVIRQAVRPNVTTNARYTNFLWVSTADGNLRSYQGTGDNDTNWVIATIGNAAIATANLAGSAVTSDKMAANAVNTTNIANNAVDSTKIGGGQVLNTHLGSQVVSNANIGDFTITGSKIAYGTILNTNLADGNISGSKLQTATITWDKIATIATNTIDAGALINSTIKIHTNNISMEGGSSYQSMAVDSSGTFVQWTTPILSQKVVIPMGTYTTNAVAYTNAHGLGGTPLFFTCVMTNNIPQANWPANSEVSMGNHDDGTAGVTVTADSVNIYVHTTGTLYINNKQTSVRNLCTGNAWGFRVTAFR